VILLATEKTEADLGVGIGGAWGERCGKPALAIIALGEGAGGLIMMPA
jgi:hypothetical protein